ncbi:MULTISPECIES: hypothetical protein [Bacillus]|uniref:hypothetical protein n=1 Tax=Bacillus TaxID=1386 RepID=UPI00201D7F6C|nr:hypothetical protein [Bacillus pseudomycoides]
MKTNTEYGLVTERREEKVIIKHLKQFLANDKRTISKIKNPSLLESKLPFKYKYFYFNLNKEMGTYIALFPNRDEDSNYKYPDNKEGFCCKVSYMKLHSRKQDLGESDMRYFKGK